MADAALRHIASALARLAEGGRLVAITGASFAPDNPAWRDAFVRLQERGRVVFSAAIDGAVYARHGTTIDTRLTVIDKRPADDPTAFRPRRASRPMSPRCSPGSMQHIPPRLPIAAALAIAPVATSAPFRAPSRASRACAASAVRGQRPRSPRRSNSPTRPSTGRRPRAAASPMRSMKNTACSRSAFPALRPHPTRLVQSAAMASVAPPKPSYRPHLPREHRHRRPAVRRPARNRHLCRRGACGLSRGIVDGRRDLRCRLGRARRRRERRALPPRLVPRRRHRRRQGPPGRRHPARQLAEGPPPRGLGLASPTS